MSPRQGGVRSAVCSVRRPELVTDLSQLPRCLASVPGAASSCSSPKGRCRPVMGFIYRLLCVTVGGRAEEALPSLHRGFRTPFH